ncbi:MAG: ABC transporter substrate-binding protein [Thermoleophilia bacterium]|jgi:branched-chain amino acid transport system substrate-binding protein
MMMGYRMALGVVLILVVGAFAVACDGNGVTTTTKAITPATGTVSTSTTGPSSEPFKVAVIVSLTGPDSAAGASVLNGVKLEIDALNAAGGIEGRRIEYTVQDDKTDMAAAMSAVELALSEGVDAVIGPLPQSTATPARELCEKAGVVNIGFGPATLAELVAGTEYRCTFLISMGADAVADAWIKAFSIEGAKNIVCIGDQNPLHQDALSLLPDLAKVAGIAVTIVPDAWSPRTTDDYTPFIKKIAAEAEETTPDAILVAGDPIASSNIYAGLRAQGVIVPVIGSPAAAAPATLLADLEKSEGFMPIGPGVVDPTVLPDGYPGRAAYVDFATRYGTAYGKSPAVHAGLGHDAVHVLALGLKAGGDDPAKVAAGVEAIKDFQGMQGVFTFSAIDHVGIHKGLALWKVTRGLFTFVASLNQ